MTSLLKSECFEGSVRKACDALGKKGASLVTATLKRTEDQQVRKGEEIQQRISPRLFSIKQAAQYLGRGVFGVRELIWAGKIPIVRDGRKMFLDRVDLDDYIQRCKTSYALREADERVFSEKQGR